jgi:hypothetical protein
MAGIGDSLNFDFENPERFKRGKVRLKTEGGRGVKSEG